MYPWCLCLGNGIRPMLTIEMNTHAQDGSRISGLTWQISVTSRNGLLKCFLAPADHSEYVRDGEAEVWLSGWHWDKYASSDSSCSCHPKDDNRLGDKKP